MESVRDLLVFFLKVSVGIFVLVLVIILTKTISRGPDQGTTTQASSSKLKVDILPSPRKYSGFFTMGSSSRNGTLKSPEFNVFTYSGPIAFSSSTSLNSNNIFYDNSNVGSYNTYVTQQSPSNNSAQNNNNPRVSYIRNLSVYEGGHIYTGISFVGEAKSLMFRDGKFPIVIVDSKGKLVGVSAAIAQTNWAVPGWVRFETKITYTLPNNTPCTMIFEEALTQTEKTRTPLRVAFPIRCN